MTGARQGIQGIRSAGGYNAYGQGVLIGNMSFNWRFDFDFGDGMEETGRSRVTWLFVHVQYVFSMP